MGSSRSVHMGNQLQPRWSDGLWERCCLSRWGSLEMKSKVMQREHSASQKAQSCFTSMRQVEVLQPKHPTHPRAHGQMLRQSKPMHLSP